MGDPYDVSFRTYCESTSLHGWQYIYKVRGDSHSRPGLHVLPLMHGWSAVSSHKITQFCKISIFLSYLAVS